MKNMFVEVERKNGSTQYFCLSDPLQVGSHVQVYVMDDEGYISILPLNFGRWKVLNTTPEGFENLGDDSQ